MLITGWLGIRGDRTYFGACAGDIPLTVVPFARGGEDALLDDRKIGMTVDAIASAVVH